MKDALSLRCKIKKKKSLALNLLSSNEKKTHLGIYLDISAVTDKYLVYFYMYACD